MKISFRLMAGVIALSTFAGAEVLTRSGSGQNNTWWHDATKWTPQQAPTAADDVIVDTAGRYDTIQVNFSEQVNSIALWFGHIRLVRHLSQLTAGSIVQSDGQIGVVDPAAKVMVTGDYTITGGRTMFISQSSGENTAGISVGGDLDFSGGTALFNFGNHDTVRYIEVDGITTLDDVTLNLMNYANSSPDPEGILLFRNTSDNLIEGEGFANVSFGEVYNFFRGDAVYDGKGFDLSKTRGSGEEATRNAPVVNALMRYYELTHDAAAIDLAEGMINYAVIESHLHGYRQRRRIAAGASGEWGVLS